MIAILIVVTIYHLLLDSNAEVTSLGMKTTSFGASSGQIKTTLYWDKEIIQCIFIPYVGNRWYYCTRDSFVCATSPSSTSQYKMYLDISSADAGAFDQIEVIEDNGAIITNWNAFCSSLTFHTNLGTCSTIGWTSLTKWDAFCVDGDGHGCNYNAIQVNLNRTTKEASISTAQRHATIYSTCSPTRSPTQPTLQPTVKPTVKPADASSIVTQIQSETVILIVVFIIIGSMCCCILLWLLIRYQYKKQRPNPDINQQNIPKKENNDKLYEMVVLNDRKIDDQIQGHVVDTNKEEKPILDIKHYLIWTSDDIVKWFMTLWMDGRFDRYELIFKKALEKEEINGSDLINLDKNDLHRLGINSFKLKNEMVEQIQMLVNQIHVEKHEMINTVEGENHTLV